MIKIKINTIMTPKEKAKDLLIKFILIELALKCVDEIISKGGTKNVIEYEINCFTNGIEYWQDVKTEINKLW